MHRYHLSLSLSLSLALCGSALCGAALTLTACEGAKTATPTAPVAAPAPAAAPGAPASAPAAAVAATQAPGRMGGTVLETMPSGGYTYVSFRGPSGPIWAAGPQTTVSVGDLVSIPGGSLMKGYRSKTLNRVFEEIWFVPAISVGGSGAAAAVAGAPVAGAPAAGAPASAPTGPAAPPRPVAGASRTTAPAASGLAPVAKAEGGSTVAEIFAGKASLGGETVTLRGHVVKFNGGIMGKNWLHVQDGTGGPESNDLTVTTQARARVGDVVLIKGTAATDKDFGSGYKYALLIEDAAVTVETSAAGAGPASAPTGSTDL